jgi:hypothetical protein
MPNLPIYNQQKNINVNTPEPLRNESSQAFQDQQKVIGTLDNIASQWSQANDVMQSTEAKAKHSLALNDIESRANSDPNFKNSEAYYKELNSANESAISSIDNQQVASQLGIELKYNSEIAKLKIDNNFRSKQLDYNKVMVQTNLDNLMSKKLSASTPAEAQHYDAEIINLVESNVQSGTIDYKQADKFVKDAQDTAVKYDIYADSATQENESQVLKDLKDYKGKYSFLAPDDRLKLIEEAQRRIFQNNQTFKRQVDQTQAVRNDTIIDKMSNETLTFRDIANEEAIPESQGGLPRKVLLQYKKYQQRGVEETLNEALKKKTPDGKQITATAKKAKEYNDLIDKYLTEDMGKWDAKELLAKALVDGQIDPEELKVLNPIRDNLRDIEFNKNTSPVAYVIKQYKNFTRSSNPTSEELAIRTKQMLKEIGAGKEPQAALKTAMDSDMLKHFPDYKTYQTSGRKKRDPNTGNAFLVFPTGEWAWVEGNKNAK